MYAFGAFGLILTLRSLQALWYELSSCNRTTLSFSGASFDLFL